MSSETPAVKVHLASSDVPLGQPGARSCAVVPRTVVLTEDDPAQLIAPQNPDREFIGICCFANPAVLSLSKGDAQAPGNLADTITAPNGALIPAGQYIWLPGADNPLWASAGTYPTMISVIEVTRRP